MYRAIAVAEVSPGVQSLLKRGFPFAVREYQLKLNQLIPFLPEVRSISGNKPNIVYNAVTFDSREVLYRNPLSPANMTYPAGATS